MKLDLKSTNGLIAVMLLVVGVAIAFWVIALSPKRDEASKLDAEAAQLEASIEQHRSETAQGEQARHDFPRDYQQLVVLGKAVPGDDDTASLLVQLTHIAERAEIEFRDIQLSSSGGEAAATPAAVPSAEGVSATEAAASLLPLGATVGGAGLGVMPYTLTFDGNFFQIADFIGEVDALVRTTNEDVAVDGRLMTVDGFSLVPDPEKGFPDLEVNFAITTYLTPPGEGLTAGATLASPETVAGTPASATIGETP